MLSAETERALEEAFLGGEGLSAPPLADDAAVSTSASLLRTTALMEVQKFLHSPDKGTSFDSGSNGRRALSYTSVPKKSNGRDPLPATLPSPSSSTSLSSSSSSSGVVDERPFHERITEARRRYQRLTRERNAPKQQSWGQRGGEESKAGRKKEQPRSYTFQAIRRSAPAENGTPSEPLPPTPSLPGPAPSPDDSSAAPSPSVPSSIGAKGKTPQVPKEKYCQMRLECVLS